jgi:hypothetical protein
MRYSIQEKQIDLLWQISKELRKERSFKNPLRIDDMNALGMLIEDLIEQIEHDSEDP